jgi:hypothetical protein
MKITVMPLAFYMAEGAYKGKLTTLLYGILACGIYIQHALPYNIGSRSLFTSFLSPHFGLCFSWV